MRNPASTRSPSPPASRWDLGVAIVSAAVAYGLFVLTCAMTVERLIAAAPPDIVAAVTGGLAP